MSALERAFDAPCLADMPVISSSRALPVELTDARTAWKQALRTSRVDPSAAARAFVRIAEALRVVPNRELTSLRLVALENALEAAAAAGERTQVTALLRGIGRTEPKLSAGIERLLRGDAESAPTRVGAILRA